MIQKREDNHLCPITEIMRLISAKWTVEIMRELSISPTRTRQFLARIPGLSMKCLQERLKELEKAGMIKRIKYKEKVPKVEHHITERGEELLKIMMSLKNLANEFIGDSCKCPIDAYFDDTLKSEVFCPRKPEDQRI